MKKYILIFLVTLMSFTAYTQTKIVVLGSSTAAGYGVSHIDSSWVNRYRNYSQSIDSTNQVINLAKGGYTTYHLLPTGLSTTNRPLPDSIRNISAALKENPDAIIINLPSNDAAHDFSVKEQLDNYQKILDVAGDIPVWITTTQGRNLTAIRRQNLVVMRDSTFAVYKDKTLDFWKNVGETDGSLNPYYDSGDGIHLNDEGHRLLFERVVEKRILEEITTNKN